MFFESLRRRPATVKQPWELAVMRQAGRKLAEVAALLRDSIQPGITPKDLDHLAEDRMRALGGTPAFLGYVVDETPFPASICSSPNEQIVHGIPDGRPLVEGDIISLDMGLIFGGYHADMAFTAGVGNISAEAQRLIDLTRESLYKGIDKAVVGGRIGDIGYAVEQHVKPAGLGIVRDYVGHGIGRAMHERPSVPNYGKRNTGELIKPGMCLAIEPMTTLGTWETKVMRDKWTVVTADGSLSAHFEHTVLVTEKGPEISTVLDGGSPV